MQNTGLRRNTIDKFYTDPVIAIFCINMFLGIVAPDINTDMFIEPSAGAGSFSNNMVFNHTIFYDIEPRADNIIKQDFLTSVISHPNKIHVIGNPPFGRQASQAKRFIKKSCEFAYSISFILPKSFKKPSMQRCFDLFFHLQYEYNVPDNSFIVNDVKYNVPCVFQIWTRHNQQRTIPPKITSNLFIFVEPSNADFAIRRVGINAGNIFVDLSNKSPHSHYFIKLNESMSRHKFLLKYSTIKFEHDNTVGARSISKSELISMTNSNITI